MGGAERYIIGLAGEPFSSAKRYSVELAEAAKWAERRRKQGKLGPWVVWAVPSKNQPYVVLTSLAARPVVQPEQLPATAVTAPVAAVVVERLIADPELAVVPEATGTLDVVAEFEAWLADP